MALYTISVFFVVNVQANLKSPVTVCQYCPPQNTNNPVVMLVKPEQIQVHELKALPNKAKVQGMVAMRQPPSSSDAVSAENGYTYM